MNIIEAVQALKDGLCDGIKRESWSGTILSLSSGIIRQYNGNDTDNLRRAENLIGDDWQLVNPKPQTETVEVKLWAIMSELGLCRATYSNVLDANRYCQPRNTVTELTGTYEREVKPKVKRRLDLGETRFDCDRLIVAGAGFYDMANRPDYLAGKIGRFIFEWEE